MVPVVNCVSNIATVSVYLKNANWSLCMRMWPWILFGICVGTAMLPYIPEPALRTLTSVIYACVLFQRIYEKQQQWKKAKKAALESGISDASTP